MIQRFLLLFLPLFLLSNTLFGQCAGSAISPWVDQFYCANTNVTLTPTITNAPSGNPTYTWTFQGQPITPNPSGSSYNIPANQSGTYAVSIFYGPNCTLSDDVVVNFLSVPMITPSQCVTSGSTANLSINFNNALPSNVTPSYSWTGPNGFTSSSATPSVSSFNSSKAGTYNVTVTFNPSTGPPCSYSLSTTLNLTPSTPTFSIPANGCLGTNYSPTGFTALPNVSYSWNVSPSSNSTGLNGSSPVFNFNNSGSYSVSVTATQNGCSATSSNQGIAIPNFTLSAPTIEANLTYYNVTTSNPNTIAICAGSNLSSVIIINNSTLTNGGSNPTGTTYTYSLNGSSPSPIIDNINQTINYGNNNLILTANYLGCTISGTYNVYSGSNPYGSFATGNSTGLCPGNSISFDINPINASGQLNPPGTTYTVTFSDSPGSPIVLNDITTLTSVSHVYNNTSCGATNPSTFPANTFYAQVVVQNLCGQTNPFVSPITVNNYPTANFTVSDSTICAGQTITVTNTGQSGSVVGNSPPYTCNSQGKFYWTITGGIAGIDYNVISGTLGSYNGVYTNPNGTPNAIGNGSNTLDITFNNAGYYTITQYYYNSCGIKSKIRNICVINPPTCQFTVNPASGCSPLTVNINNTTIAPTCGGTPIPLSYAWTITSPNGTSSSYTSNSSQVPPALTLTNPTTTPQTFTISLVVNPKDPYNISQNFGNPNCVSNCSQTVTVNPIPIFTPLNITSCISPYQANVNLQTSTNMSSTFTWIASSNTNVAGQSLTTQISSTISDNLSNQSTLFQTINYSITPTSLLGCVGTTQSSSITLNYIIPGTISSDQTVCSGGDPALLTASLPSGFGTVSYQWQSSSNNINWTNIPGATSASYDPPTTTNTIYYRRVVNYLSNGVTCSANSNVITISINAVNAGTIGSPQNVCTGDDPTLLSVLTTPTASGAISYQWQSSTTSATTGFANIANQTGISYNPPILNTTTWYQLTINSMFNGVSCSSTTPSIAITVYSLIPGVISSNQTICVGGDPLAFAETTTASASTGTLSYQWQSSTDNINWTNISGSTSATYNPPVLNSTTYYRRIVMVYSGSTLICQGYSNNLTITIIPDPTVTSPTPQTICTGGNPVALTVSASGGINTTYSHQWYNASGAITAATGASYTPPSSAGDYYCIVSILPSTSGCSVNSTTATVSVVPDPTVSAPQSASYCQNASTVAALSVTANGGISTAYVYQWYSNTNNNTTTGTAILAANGGTSASFTPPVNNTGTLYYYCVVSINPSSTTGCSVTSAIATITVNAGPSITTPSQSQSICVGGTLSDLTVAYSGGTGTVTYQWYSNTTNSTTGGTAVGTSSSTYALPSTLNTSAGTSYYYCQLSFGGSGGCSQIISAVATISVVADPTVTAPTSQTICTGGSPVALTVSASGGINTTYSHQWYNASGAITAATGASYTPPSSAGDYYCIVSILPSTSGCSVNSTTATVSVVPDPTVSTPQSASYCQNASTVAALSVTANGGISTAYVYQWYSNTNNNTTTGTAILAANGGTSASFTPPVNNTGTLYYYCVVSINPSSTTGCSVTSAIATITVNAGPSITTPSQSQSICVGGTLSDLTVAYSGGTGTVTYQWYSNTTNSTTGGTTVGTSSSTYALPSTLNTSAGTSYYYCQLSFGGSGGCSQIITSVATISVVADPTVTAPTSQTICTGGNPVALTVSANGGINSNYSYQWYNASGAITSATSALYTPPSSAGDYYCIVSILPSTTGCSMNSTTAAVSVVPDPTVSAPQSASYCQNASTVAALSVTANGGINTSYVYQWYSNTQNNTTTGTAITAANGGTLASYTPQVNSTGIIYYYCIVSINPTSTTGCSVTSAIATITVNAGPSITTPPQSQSICVGGTLSDLTVAYSGGTGTVTYQWYSNTTNSTTGGTAVGTSSSTYALPSTLNTSAGTSYYYCQLSFGGSGGCSQIISAVATISVVADPTVTAPTSQTICTGGSPVALTVSASGGINTTYSHQWYNASGAITAATGASYTPPSSAGDYYCIVSILPSTSGCSVNSTTATVSVVPDPTVSAPQSASYCQNASTVAALSVTANGGISTAYVYQWYSNTNNNTTTGTAILAANGGTSASFTPPVNNTGTLYYYCVVSINPSSTTGCSVTSAIATITVNAGPSITTPSQSQYICVGGTLSDLTVAYSGGTGTVTYQWYSNTTNSTTGGTTVGTSSSTYALPSTLNTSAGTSYYYCQLSFGGSGGCSQIITSVATISVVADPTVTAPTSQTICTGGNPVALTVSANGGINSNYSYQWYNASGAITSATSALYTPPSSAGDYYCIVSILPSTTGCSMNSTTATVSVVPDPTVSAPQSASYCQNASTVAALSVTANGGISTAYAYQWYSNAQNNTTTGTAITAGNGGTLASYTPPVNSTGIIYYYCIVSISPASTTGCSVTSAIATITVNAAPTFSTPPLTTQTVCLNGSFNSLTVTTQNGTGTPTFQWYSNNTSSTSGGTPISGATTASYIPPANAVGTIYYYCIATFATGGCSSITSAIAAAIVVSDPIIIAQPITTQFICVGGNIASALTATASGGTGTFSYQWNNVAGPISGATTQNFTPPGFTTVGQYNYSVTITQSGSGCNALTSQNALINVVDDPIISTQPQNATYCQNASPVTPLTVTATGGIGTYYSYQWFNGVSPISGATLSTYTPSVANTGSLDYACQVTLAPTTSGCAVTSAIGTITVNLAPTFSTPPLITQTVCLDGTFNALTVATQNGTGTPTFQWFSNTSSSTSGGAPISGATSASYTPPANTVGTTYYYCIATFATGGCSNITSTIGTAIVVADPLISTQPIASQSICVGGTIGAPITATATGGTGTYSYQWNNATGAISGATNQNYTPPAFTTVGQYNYTVTITQSGSGCNALTSQNALVEVVADPVVSTQPINAEYCQNASPVAPLSVSATGGIGTFSYQWYSNTANNNTNGSLIPGATSSTFSPPVVIVGTMYYYCIITQTGLNCGVTSNTAEIIVNLAPTFATQPLATQTICLDGTFNALTLTTQNGTGTPTFQWFSNTTSSTSGGALIPGASSASYTPPGTVVGNTYFYCVATYATGGCTAITSALATAVVVADPTISIQPIPAQSICVGGNIANALTVTAAGGTGTTSYQWSTSTGAITGATNQSYSPPPFNIVDAFTYNVTVTLSGSGCNLVSSQNAVIDVVADPIVSTQPISASYCQNGSPVSPLTVAATGGLGTFSYQWYSNTLNSNSGGTLILGAASSSYTPSVATVGVQYYYCVLTQTGLNCGVTSNAASITVSLAPTFVLQPISQTICTGGTFAPLSVTYQDGTGVPSYQWFSNSTNSYSGAVAISGATNSTFQPSAANLGTIYYFCEISFSFGGCSSISSNISNQTVVADPIISVEPQVTQSICVGGTIPTALNVTVTGGTGAITYQWFAGTNQVNGATQNTFLPSNFNTAGTFNFTANISISGVGCDALISQPAQVSVVEDPSVTQPLAAVYCQNASPIAPLQVNVSGGLGTNSYQWYFSAANTTSGGTAIAGANTSSYIPSVATVGTAYYYCIVNQSAPNCATTSANAPIQVNIPPTISSQPLATQTLCEGGSPTLLQVAYINGTNSATYQWYSNNINSNTGGTPIANATTASYNPQSVILGTTFYYCVITFQQGGCSSLTTITAQVTIVGDPEITAQPLDNQEICQGNTINNALTFNYAGGTGNATIAWYLAATPPVLINGVTTNTYLPIPFNVADTFNYFATLTFDGVGCNVINTQLAEIIVHPTPYATNLNDTLVVCNNSNLSIPLTATVTSTFNWQTQLTTAVNGESFLPQTSYSIDDSLSNTTTSPQFLTYTVKPTSFPYGCVGPDSTVVVQVQPDVILSMNQAMEICSGSPVNGILTSNVPSTFNWFVSIDNPNVTGESIFPSTNWLVNDVLVNTSTVNQVVVYSVFPVSIQGQCPGLAQPLVVTVKPPIDLLNPDTLTICSGQNTGINLVANTNVNFNWYAAPSLNVSGETTSVVSSALINDVLVNPTNAVEVVTYNVIGTSTANGCSSPVIPLYVVVNPIPSLVNLNPLTICNGNYLYPYSLQTSVVGATTNWSVLNNPIGIPSTFGSNTLPGFIATNNTIITQTGQIQITPIYTNNNVTCIGNDTTLLIPVLPTPSVNPLADITACNLTQLPLTPVSGPVPNTVYEWYNANVSLGLNASGIGDIPTFVGLNNTTIPVSGTVTVAPSYTQNNVTCQGNPIDFEITINPSPTLLNSNIEICDGESTNMLLNANIPSTFQWNANIQANVYNETAAPVQNNAFINDQLVLATTTAQTVTYNVTPISAPYGCIGFDTTILVQVNPLPIVDFTVITPILCDQSQINFQNNSVGSLDFTWTFGDGDSSFLFNPVHEYANFGSFLVTLEAVDQITGCFNSADQTIVIHESPEADFIISDTLACGSLDVTFNALDLNPNWSYLWTFGDGTSSNQYGLAGHQYVTNGCFDINLQISTPEGCVSDTTQLNAICVYPEPIAAFTMDDPVVSSLTPEVQFFNSSLFADSYLWEFGDGTTSQTENPSHLFPSDPATYVIILTASNNVGCQDTAALSVTIWQDLAIYVPNTFTPDGDEYNQTFKPVLTEGFKKDSYKLMIFNRWGQVVFVSEDYNIGWDGTYGSNGNISPVGTYTWKIEVTELQSGETRRFLGHVNLIR